MNLNPASLLLAAALGLSPLGSSTASSQTDSERLERLERAVEMLQQRNSELEQEVRSLKTQTVSVPAARSQSAPAPAPLPEGKAVVEKEKKEPVYAIAGASEFKLTLSGLFQTQLEAGDVFAFEGRFGVGTGEVKDRFRIRRARIIVSGDYTEHFDFKLEGEFAQSDTALTVRDANGQTLASNATRTSFGALDLFVNWHTFPELNIKVGQYKAPFGLEQLTPDPKLITPERTLVTTALTPERQIGVQIWGKPLTNIWPEQKDLITYFAGVFNGTGRNITVNDNNEFMYVGRLEVQALRSKILNQEVTVKLGANGLSSRDETGTAISSLLSENSGGSLSAFTLPSPGTRTAYGLDFSLKIGPFDFSAEYINEEISPRGLAPLFNCFTADGYYLQGGYFLIPKKLQFASKWESFNPDQLPNDDIESLSAGLNYYLKGDDIKLLAHYIHTWSEFRENNPAQGKSEFDEVIIRLQLLF